MPSSLFMCVHIYTYAQMHICIGTILGSVCESAPCLLIRVQIFSGSVSGRQRGRSFSAGAPRAARWAVGISRGRAGTGPRAREPPGCDPRWLLPAGGMCRQGKLVVGTFSFRKMLVTKGYLLGLCQSDFSGFRFFYTLNFEFLYFLFCCHMNI